MLAPLADLIQRLENALSDPDTKPLWLHWSDTELLRAIQIEMVNDALVKARLRDTVSSALDVALGNAGR